MTSEKIKNEFDNFNLKLLSVSNKLNKTYQALDRLESNLSFVEELYRTGFKSTNHKIANISKEIHKL